MACRLIYENLHAVHALKKDRSVAVGYIVQSSSGGRGGGVYYI